MSAILTFDDDMESYVEIGKIATEIKQMCRRNHFIDNEIIVSFTPHTDTEDKLLKDCERVYGFPKYGYRTRDVIMALEDKMPVTFFKEVTDMDDLRYTRLYRIESINVTKSIMLDLGTLQKFVFYRKLSDAVELAMQKFGPGPGKHLCCLELMIDNTKLTVNSDSCYVKPWTNDGNRVLRVEAFQKLNRYL